MHKSATLIRKHLTPSRTSLALLALAGVLFTSRPAAAQTLAPFRFASQVSAAPDFTKDVSPTKTTVRDDGDDTPFSVSVSPSSTTGKFLVSIKGNKEDRVTIKVTDKHGCVVDKHEVPGQSNLQLGFWYFPGTYSMHVTSGGSTQTLKLEKLKEER